MNVLVKWIQPLLKFANKNIFSKLQEKISVLLTLILVQIQPGQPSGHLQVGTRCYDHRGAAGILPASIQRSKLVTPWDTFKERQRRWGEHTLGTKYRPRRPRFWRGRCWLWRRLGHFVQMRIIQRFVITWVWHSFGYHSFRLFSHSANYNARRSLQNDFFLEKLQKNFTLKPHDP